MFVRKYKGNTPARIEMHSNDVYVGNYLVYVNEDNLACFDPEGLNLMMTDTLVDLYTKGMVIVDGGIFYTPLSMVQNESGVEIAFIKYDSIEKEAVYATVSSVDRIGDLEEDEPEEEIDITAPMLAELSFGELELTPTFNPSEFNYTMTTESAGDLMTLVVVPDTTPVLVELNGLSIVDYDDLGITWDGGENVVTITLGDETPAVVYTVTVNAS